MTSVATACGPRIGESVAGGAGFGDLSGEGEPVEDSSAGPGTVHHPSHRRGDVGRSRRSPRSIASRVREPDRAGRGEGREHDGADEGVRRPEDCHAFTPSEQDSVEFRSQASVV